MTDAAIVIVRKPTRVLGLGRWAILTVSRPEPPHELAIPGGHVDPGETPEQAAARELKEECGIDVGPLTRSHVTLRSPVDGRTVHVFEATSFRGEPYPAEPNTRIAWLTPSQLLEQASLFRESVSELIDAGVFESTATMDLGVSDVHAPSARPEREVPMAEISSETRADLPEDKFAWPEKRKFLIEDASHVRNAASRLAQAVKQGRIDKATAAKIHARIAAAGKKFGVEVTAADHAPATRDNRRRPPRSIHVRADLAPGGALHVRHMASRSFYDGELVALSDAASVDEKPVWIQVAKLGSFAGHPSGPFKLDTKTFREIVANFKSTTNRRVAIDYEHASEQDPTSGSIPVSGAPAQGWIVDLAIRDDGNLWGLVEWGAQAREQIRSGGYRYLSPAIRFGSKDRVTGNPIGARLSSAALTNEPFLDGMQPLAAKDSGGVAAAEESRDLAGKGGRLSGPVHSPHEYMPKLKAALKLDELATPKECSDKLDRLRDCCLSAGPTGAHQGVDMSEYTQPLRDLVDAPPGMTWEDVFDTVEDLIAHAIDQHVAEMHPEAGANLDDGDDFTMSEKEQALQLKDAQTQVTALTDKVTSLTAEKDGLATKLKDTEGQVTTLTASLSDANEKLVASTTKVTGLEAQLSLRDGELKALRDEKTKRDEADLVAEVEAAFVAYKDVRKLTDKSRENLLAFAKANITAFRAEFPPVPANERYLMRGLVPPENRGEGGTAVGAEGEPHPMSLSARTQKIMDEEGLPFDAAQKKAAAMMPVVRRKAAR